jgi:hypothetical protein
MPPQIFGISLDTGFKCCAILFLEGTSALTSDHPMVLLKEHVSLEIFVALYLVEHVI